MSRQRLLIVIAAITAVTAFAVVGWQSSQTDDSGSSSDGLLSGLLGSSEPITVPAGTSISVRTEVTLSTESQENGDEFRATLAEPIVVDGKTVASDGARVNGLVAESDPGGKVKGRAQLSVRLSELDTADWGRVNLTTNTVIKEAPGSKGRDAATIGAASGAGAGVGAAAGGGKGAGIGAAAGAAAGTAAVLATRGRPSEIPAGTILTFQLSQPLRLGS